MSGRSDHKAYHLIAIEAGRRCGVSMPTVAEVESLTYSEIGELTKAIADCPAAAELRDELFADFERRLRDPGYNGMQVHEWFEGEYGHVACSSMYRTRASLMAAESRITEIAAQARAFVDASVSEGADEVFTAANKRIGQLMFQLLMEADAASLSEGKSLNISKFTSLASSLAKLQASRAQAELNRERVAAMKREIKTEVEKATAATGTVTRQEVFEMIDRIMRGEAA